MKRFLLLVALGMCGSAYSQQYNVPVPKDIFNEPIYGGLGAPRTFEITVDETTYATDYFTIPVTGMDVGRQFRSFFAFNPSATRTLYVCFGDDSGCTGDNMKIRPGYGLVFDGVLIGYYNKLTRVYFRLDAAGSVDIDTSVW